MGFMEFECFIGIYDDGPPLLGYRGINTPAAYHFPGPTNAFAQDIR